MQNINFAEQQHAEVIKDTRRSDEKYNKWCVVTEAEDKRRPVRKNKRLQSQKGGGKKLWDDLNLLPLSFGNLNQQPGRQLLFKTRERF